MRKSILSLRPNRQYYLSEGLCIACFGVCRESGPHILIPSPLPKARTPVSTKMLFFLWELGRGVVSVPGLLAPSYSVWALYQPLLTPLPTFPCGHHHRVTSHVHTSSYTQQQAHHPPDSWQSKVPYFAWASDDHDVRSSPTPPILSKPQGQGMGGV